MPYAILRFKKTKGGGVASCEKHDERKKEAYKSNPDIDVSRSIYNYHLVSNPSYNYKQQIKKLTQEAGCKVRRNSTVLVQTLITASPEFMKKLTKEEQKEYFQRALDFMKEKIGEKNIISAVVHMDEKTPHMHLSFCPITEDNRLSAKDILGNQKKLSEWQTEFHKVMSARWKNLERGESSMETKRKHIPTWLFKMGTKLGKEYDEIVKTINDIGVLNMGKSKEKAIKVLQNWYPKASKFVEEITRLKADLEYYKDISYDLKHQLEHKAVRVSGLEAHIEILEHELERQEELIDKVPPEILQEIKGKGKKKNGRERS